MGLLVHFVYINIYITNVEMNAVFAIFRYVKNVKTYNYLLVAFYIKYLLKWFSAIECNLSFISIFFCFNKCSVLLRLALVIYSNLYLSDVQETGQIVRRKSYHMIESECLTSLFFLYVNALCYK